ncbi:MAG: apolipoprotein N-acyltransferase [Flavobacteriales bacterium]|nr:apolipoprotein N-acyltransferase [Flavobacteriales bacterium]
MRIKMVHLLSLSILGGCMMGLSFPFTGGIFPLAFIGLVPLLFINFELNGDVKFRFWKRFGLNYLFFLIYNVIATWWIYNASPAGMYMAVLTNSLMMTVPLFLTGFISRQVGEGKGLLAFMMLWLSFEYGHYYGEISWPWLNFGHIFATSPKLIQWYEYSGVLGGTFWILFVNVFIYITIRNVWLKKESFKIQTPNLVMIAAGFIIPIASSLLMFYGYEEKDDPVDVVCVQPNIDSNTEKFVLPQSVQFTKMFGLASEKMDAETDLVVFPETAIAYPILENKPDAIGDDILDDQQAIIDIKTFLSLKDNVPIMIGASTNRFFDKENSVASVPWKGMYYENYNTTLLIEPNKPTQFYHKDKPVLGGEKVPFIGWLPFLKEYSVELGGTSGVIGPGSPIKNMEASGLKFSPLICYESVYGEFATYFTRRGTDILCIITNDGWYGNTAGHKQHCSFAQIRAIENRRSVVRSANTGISCLINQRGEILQSLPWDTEGALKGTLNRNEELTFYVRYGDLLGRVPLFLAIGLFIMSITTYVKSRGIQTDSDSDKK